ncbi:hypothetical protein [Arthrobacter sp. D1-17]
MHQQQRPDDGPASSEDPVSHAESAQTPEEILAYWTPERMAGAQPREIRIPGPDENPAQEPAGGSKKD